MNIEFKDFLSALYQAEFKKELKPEQIELAEYLANGPSKAVALAYRGAYKSFILSAFAIWSAHSKTVMIVTPSPNRSVDIKCGAKHLLEICTELGLADANIATKALENIKTSYRDANLDESKFDLVLVDDIEGPRDIKYFGRTPLFKWVKKLIKAQKSAKVVFVGSPAVKDSLYKYLHEKKGYGLEKWPFMQRGTERELAVGSAYMDLQYRLIMQ